jgi:Domain of unknown function (DUF4062)
MARAATRPNVAVFVSSTFTDLQVYRRKIQDGLTQLEAIVRGMEQFGSKPGSPVEECLKVVQSCRLYVGVFGMRYGSIPDGYEKSMTNIEYDEAQRLGLPSLIYLLNETHPIPPKDVETGPNAEKLEALKEQLKKRHVVSFFTTPEDLQARIMHDVPAQLAGMGVEVTGGLQRAEEASDIEVLKNFEILPKIYSGRQVTIQFSLANVRATMPEDCVALHLEHGASVASHVVIETGQTFYVYGERDIALSLLGLAKGSTVKARANTVFGICKQVIWTEDEPLPDIRAETGLVITEILNVEPPAT